MNPATLRKIVENHIATLEGNGFQDLCDRLCMKLFPDDYTPVRAAGPKGDRKNDGYCPKARTFFAAHATRGEALQKTKDKIKSDLEGCLMHHTDVVTWIFLTNDTLPGDVEAYVDEELRSMYPGPTIETWGHKRISEKACSTFPQSVIEEIVDMPIGPTLEITAEIDHAKDLVKGSRPLEARAILEHLWSQHNDMMSARQRFRVQANIGHSYQAQAQWEEAARCFLKAKQYDPMYEKARELEALAHLWLGNRAKAEELSASLLVDFPEGVLAVSIHIRSIPLEVDFDTIERTVPAHLRDDPEVALALAEAAMVRDLPEAAESYAARAHSEGAGAVTMEALADALVMRARIHERFVQGRTATKDERDCLEKACSLYTDAIKTQSVQSSPKQVARLRHKRSDVFLALDNEGEWEKDCTIAYELDPSDEHAVFKYAGVKEKHGHLDEAINLIQGLLKKRVRPLVELRLAQQLLERKGPGDVLRARELLLSRLDDLRGESPEICVEYLMWLSDVERGLNGTDAALALLERTARDLVDHEGLLLLKAELLRLSGNTEKAIKAAQELEPLVGESSRSDTVRRTATLLQALGLHSSALSLWKRTVRFDYIGTDTLRAIDCAQRCGDVQYILDLSSGLWANGVYDTRFLDLELSYREQYNDTATVIEILQDFLKHSPIPDYLPQARLRLSTVGIRTSRNELIETDPLRLPRVTDVSPMIGQHVVEVLRRGPNPMLAATYAYEMVRLNWDDAHAHAAMARVFFPDGPVPTIDEPTHVVAGSTVCYTEDDTGREHWHTIEDSLIGTPKSVLHEYGLDNPVSQAMLNKKVGDQFYLVKDHIQERTATIKDVMSKYKYRFNDSLRELATRFSHTGFVREISVTRDEGCFDFSALERMAERRAKSVKKMEEVYRDNLCPIYLLSIAGGRSVIETVEYVIGGTNLNVRCCMGSDEEQEEATQSFDAAKAIVLDSMCLTTLLLTESYPALNRLPVDLLVTEGTLSDLRSTPYMHGDPHTQAGSFSTNGFVPTSAESIMKARSALQALIDFIVARCKVRSGTVVASLEGDEREKLLGLFGAGVLESMVLASQSESVLWTDDMGTAAFAKGRFGCRRVWSQFVFEYSARKGTLPHGIANEVAVQLFAMRYYYVRPSVSIIMRAVEKSDGDVDRTPLRQVLDWFSDKNAKKEGQFMIAAGTLKSLWQSSVVGGTAQRLTIRILERLAQRPGGLDVIKGLLQNVDAIFGLDVVHAAGVREVVEAWLKGSRTRIIIP